MFIIFLANFNQTLMNNLITLTQVLSKLTTKSKKFLDNFLFRLENKWIFLPNFVLTTNRPITDHGTRLTLYHSVFEFKHTLYTTSKTSLD